MGHCQYYIKHCIEQPGKWVINDYKDLFLSPKELKSYKKKDQNCGEIYI